MHVLEQTAGLADKHEAGEKHAQRTYDDTFHSVCHSVTSS